MNGKNGGGGGGAWAGINNNCAFLVLRNQSQKRNSSLIDRLLFEVTLGRFVFGDVETLPMC